MNTEHSRTDDDPPADEASAPGNAQNPDDTQPEGGAHSPSQAAGEAGDGDDGRG